MANPEVDTIAISKKNTDARPSFPIKPSPAKYLELDAYLSRSVHQSCADSTPVFASSM